MDRKDKNPEKMDIEELEKELSQKQLRFVAELEVDGNATQAAIRAGYAPGRDNKSAAVTASRMLRNAKIAAYRRARALETFKNLGLSHETVAARLINIYNRCMQAVPVLEWDREERKWVETGEWRFNSAGALKALELIGDSQGMFTKKTVNENVTLSLEEYLERLDRIGQDHEY